MSIKTLFSFVLMLYLCNACYPLTKMESGRTVGKENLGFDGGFFYQRFPSSLDSLTKARKYEFNNQSQFYFDMKMGYGVNDRMDVGLVYKFPFFVGLNTKYQFLGTQYSNIAMATGASIIRKFGPSNAKSYVRPDDFDFSPPRYILSIPMHISFHNDPFHSFFIPQYNIIIDKSREGLSNYNSIGMSMGWALKLNKMQIQSGISYYRTLSIERHVFAIGVGYKYFFIHD